MASNGVNRDSRADERLDPFQERQRSMEKKLDLIAAELQRYMEERKTQNRAPTEVPIPQEARIHQQGVQFSLPPEMWPPPELLQEPAIRFPEPPIRVQEAQFGYQEVGFWHTERPIYPSEVSFQPQESGSLGVQYPPPPLPRVYHRPLELQFHQDSPVQPWEVPYPPSQRPGVQYQSLQPLGMQCGPQEQQFQQQNMQFHPQSMQFHQEHQFRYQERNYPSGCSYGSPYCDSVNWNYSTQTESGYRDSPYQSSVFSFSQTENPLLFESASICNFESNGEYSFENDTEVQKAANVNLVCHDSVCEDLKVEMFSEASDNKLPLMPKIPNSSPLNDQKIVEGCSLGDENVEGKVDEACNVEEKLGADLCITKLGAENDSDLCILEVKETGIDFSIEHQHAFELENEEVNGNSSEFSEYAYVMDVKHEGDVEVDMHVKEGKFDADLQDVDKSMEFQEEMRQIVEKVCNFEDEEQKMVVENQLLDVDFSVTSQRKILTSMGNDDVKHEPALDFGNAYEVFGIKGEMGSDLSIWDPGICLGKLDGDDKVDELLVIEEMIADETTATIENSDWFGVDKICFEVYGMFTLEFSVKWTKASRNHEEHEQLADILMLLSYKMLIVECVHIIKVATQLDYKRYRKKIYAVGEIVRAQFTVHNHSASDSASASVHSFDVPQAKFSSQQVHNHSHGLFVGRQTSLRFQFESLRAMILKGGAVLHLLHGSFMSSKGMKWTFGFIQAGTASFSKSIMFFMSAC